MSARPRISGSNGCETEKGATQKSTNPSIAHSSSICYRTAARRCLSANIASQHCGTFTNRRYPVISGWRLLGVTWKRQKGMSTFIGSHSPEDCPHFQQNARRTHTRCYALRTRMCGAAPHARGVADMESRPLLEFYYAPRNAQSHGTLPEDVDIALVRARSSAERRRQSSTHQMSQILPDYAPCATRS